MIPKTDEDFVKMYTIYDDAPIITGQPKQVIDNYIQVQRARDGDFLQKMIRERIRMFPMKMCEFQLEKIKLVNLTCFEDHLILIFLLPDDNVLSVHHGEEKMFGSFKEATCHFSGISQDKKIQHIAVKVTGSL
jgi:hypothetical protein